MSSRPVYNTVYSPLYAECIESNLKKKANFFAVIFQVLPNHTAHWLQTYAKDWMTLHKRKQGFIKMKLKLNLCSVLRLTTA